MIILGFDGIFPFNIISGKTFGRAFEYFRVYDLIFCYVALNVASKITIKKY